MTHHPRAHRDVLPLGQGPRPTTGPDLMARALVSICEMTAGTVDGLDRAHLAATVEGPDVPTLEVDLTGLVVRAGALETVRQSARGFGDVRHREPGVLGTADLRGHPVTVAEVPVTLDAVAHGLSFAWLEGVDGAVAVEPQEPGEDAPVSGQARLAAPRERVVDAVRSRASGVLAAQGFALSRLDLAFTSLGPTTVRAQADARVRKGVVSATARVAATVDVSDTLVLSLRDVEASSRNPLVAALLLAARSRLEGAQRKRVDLTAVLPPGVLIRDLRLDVGDDLVLSARLAAPAGGGGSG